MLSPFESLISKAYAAFNRRDIATALSTMHPNVQWPRAFEDGYATGHGAIREYWERQWAEINPRVDPVAIEEQPDGKVAVTVHQVVKDLQGSILFDGTVEHIYTVQDGLLQRMDIEG